MMESNVCKNSYFAYQANDAAYSTLPPTGDSHIKRTWPGHTGDYDPEELYDYRKIFNVSRTNFQTLNDSCLILKLSLSNPWKSCVKSRMKMYLEQRRQAMLQLHLSDQQFHCQSRCVLY